MGQFISNIAEWLCVNRECVSMTIDIIGTIATVAAVIVAIVANHKANQSIKCSLKMQEQSKNIDLFEKRISLIKEIESSRKTDKLVLKMLFDNDIVDTYDWLQESFSIKNDIENDISIYKQICRSADGEGG